VDLLEVFREELQERLYGHGVSVCFVLLEYFFGYHFVLIVVMIFKLSVQGVDM
jgi:hypothetical protein